MDGGDIAQGRLGDLLESVAELCVAFELDPFAFVRLSRLGLSMAELATAIDDALRLLDELEVAQIKGIASPPHPVQEAKESPCQGATPAGRDAQASPEPVGPVTRGTPNDNRLDEAVATNRHIEAMVSLQRREIERHWRENDEERTMAQLDGATQLADEAIGEWRMNNAIDARLRMAGDLIVEIMRRLKRTMATLGAWRDVEALVKKLNLKRNELGLPKIIEWVAEGEAGNTNQVRVWDPAISEVNGTSLFLWDYPPNGREGTQREQIATVLNGLTNALRYVGGLCDEMSKQAAPGSKTMSLIGPIEYVTLMQMAAIVNKSKRTLERLRDKRKLPAPAVKGGTGKADEWQWPVVRPILQDLFKRNLPERFPADRFIHR